MARPLRIQYPGALYHLIGRGNARQPIVTDNADRRMFLALLADVIEQRRWLCHAYCLMPNHYHLLVETPDADLSRGMRQLNGVYTQRYNRRHRRVGHLFQGRFKAVLVQRDTHLVQVARYIVLNPVAAGLVARPEDFLWSSYRAAAGFTRSPLWLTCRWLFSQFAADAANGRARYRAFVHKGISAPKFGAPARGPILGDPRFIDAHRPYLDPKRAVREFARRERYADRPRLDALLREGIGNAKPARNRAVRRAHRDHGYSAAEIARRLGLHPSTVSRIVARCEADRNARFKT